MDVNDDEWRNPNSADGFWDDDKAPYGTPPAFIRSNADRGAATGRVPVPVPIQRPGGRGPKPPSAEDRALGDCVRALRAFGRHKDRLLYKPEVRDQIASCILTYRRGPLSKNIQVHSNIHDELSHLGGRELQARLDSGALPVDHLARLVRRFYDEVRDARRAGGFRAALAAVRAMPENHEAGFNPRLVGWVALRDVMGDQPLRDLRAHYGMPKNLPTSIATLLRFAHQRPRFERKHPPEGLIGVAVLLAHSEEGQLLGRKRKLRSYKGQNRRKWNVSMFPSTAFLQAVADSTGASVTTVRTVLRLATFQLPPELYIV